ncbi:MAG TPA: MerR family transcriptional regulator [Polyangiaceae bacterium]|jgi:DNA-binding transcriptional MerR regulator|nr:MerR family transcriptional regulator [Polyangiaceae bacterium]
MSAPAGKPTQEASAAERPELPPLTRQFYRIGEVSRIVGVQPHVLRYWESEFRVIRPSKSSRGQRLYSKRDVQCFLRVKDLLKNQGFSIAGARRRLAGADADSPPGSPLAQSLESSGVGHSPVQSVSAPPSAQFDLPLAGATSDARRLRRALVRLRRELIELLTEFP